MFFYKDFENLKISWNEVFFAAKTQYFVYIYGEYCGHCQNIKKQVLEFTDDEIFPIYFVPFVDEIPVKTDIENTIGKTDISSIYIKGIPTLLEIDFGVLVQNVAGEQNVLALLYSKKK